MIQQQGKEAAGKEPMYLISESGVQQLKEWNDSAYNRWEQMEELLRSHPARDKLEERRQQQQEGGGK